MMMTVDQLITSMCRGNPGFRAEMAAAKERFMKRRYRFRSAETGRWVSAAYAKCHPKTTVREKV